MSNIHLTSNYHQACICLYYLLIGANSDIPSTLENNISIIENKDQTISSNRFVNSLRKSKDNAADGPKSNTNSSPIANAFLGLQKVSLNGKGNELYKSQIQLLDQSNGSAEKPCKKRGFGKNLFASQFSEKEATGTEQNRKLFLIPETGKNNEMELDSSDNISTTVPSNRNSQDTKNVRMTEEMSIERQGVDSKPRSRGRLDFDSAHDNQECEERCHTPSKAKKLFVNQEETNFIVQKQEHQETSLLANSQVFAMGFHAHSTVGTTQFCKESFPKKEQYSSRFEADFEKNEILGSGYFGTVYKCLNRIDGLEYAVKTIRYRKKGNSERLENRMLRKNVCLGASHMNQALNEVHALALLSMDENPFIVRYFYAWFENEFLHLVVI